MKLQFRTRHEPDFERLGYNTAKETRDLEKAKEVCAHTLYSYKLNLDPEIEDTRGTLATREQQQSALCVQLYGNDEPIDDKKMLARRTVLNVLSCLFAGVLITSVAAHTYRFILFGIGMIAALAIGVSLTVTVVTLGHMAFDKLIGHNKSLQAAVIIVAVGLMMWGVYQLAEAGSFAMAKSQSRAASTSYVDGDATTPTADPDAHEQSDEHAMEDLLSAAVTKILVAADLLIGILLGIIVQLRCDDKYAGWQKLGKLESEIAELRWRLNLLSLKFEIAQRDCMAGILRFIHSQRTSPPAYYQALVLVFLATACFATKATAQTITRQEGILIDVSASISHGSQQILLRQYLNAANHLLATEPANSRVYVSVIATDSFGGIQELVTGWTPDRKGVFTDDLNRARHELAADFGRKAAGLAPIASGTDIIGALWRMKALMESSPTTGPGDKEIWIFSDMMNETPEFNMPALLSLGPDQMLERARSAKLIVPLHGFRVHIQGASMMGMTPKEWATAKAFWAAYFRDASADVVTYSVDANGLR